MQMLVPILGLVGFAIALLIYQQVKSQPVGNDKMREISEAIHNGAMAFLAREYKVLGIFIGIVFLLIAISMGFWTALCFVGGAACSMTCGFIGMKAPTRANVRTSDAARAQGQDRKSTSLNSSHVRQHRMPSSA